MAEKARLTETSDGVAFFPPQNNSSPDGFREIRVGALLSLLIGGFLVKDGGPFFRG